MPKPTMLPRRKALQFLTGAPLLPLGSAVSATGLLTACGGGDDGPAKNYVAASFTSMAAPTLANPQAMARMTVASQLKVQFSDNSEQSRSEEHTSELQSQSNLV